MPPILEGRNIEKSAEYVERADWQASIDFARARVAFNKGQIDVSTPLIERSVELFAKLDPPSYGLRQDAEALL